MFGLEHGKDNYICCFSQFCFSRSQWISRIKVLTINVRDKRIINSDSKYFVEPKNNRICLKKNTVQLVHVLFCTIICYLPSTFSYLCVVSDVSPDPTLM